MLLVSPTSIFMTLGVKVALFPEPTVGTTKRTELLERPFCDTRAIPVADCEATVATIWVSAQLETIPGTLPSQMVPLPWLAPKLDPEIVTWVPGTPEAGFTPVICGVPSLKETELLQTPY